MAVTASPELKVTVLTFETVTPANEVGVHVPPVVKSLTINVLLVPPGVIMSPAINVAPVPLAEPEMERLVPVTVSLPVVSGLVSVHH